MSDTTSNPAWRDRPRGATPSEATANRRAVRRWRRGRRWVFVTVAVLIAVILLDHLGLTHGASPGPKLDTQRVRVVSVIDGDTIDIDDAGTVRRVRLLGVDAPEIAHDGDTADYWGNEATRYAAARCEGKSVTLKFEGTQTRDRYGRLLAWVYLSDTESLNVALVRDGQAYFDRRFDVSQQTNLARVEEQARKAKRGLWAQVEDDQQPAWRQRWRKRADDWKKSD